MIGAGSTAIGASAIVGSGAFSTAKTGDRRIEVDVTGDGSSYLALRPADDDTQGNNGHYADINDDGKLELILDGSDDFGTANEGEGVNPDSTYRFDNVFEIQNQGPNAGGGQGELDVWISKNTAGRVDFYWGSNVSDPRDPGDDAEDADNPSSMSPGEGHYVGFEVDASGLVEGDTIDGDIVVKAENTAHHSSN